MNCLRAFTTALSKFQFSLLSVLVLVTVTGAGLGVWHGMIAPIRQQWQAADTLMEAGISVESRPAELPRWLTVVLREERSGNIVAVDFNRVPATDNLVKSLTKLPHLERLYMEGTNATDKHARTIARIQTLRRVALWDTPLTDAGGQALAGLESLEMADLHRTRTTWRTNLAFQERSPARLQTPFNGRVNLQEFADLAAVARLRPPVSHLEVTDLTTEQLTACLNTLKHLDSLRLNYRRRPLTSELLQIVRRRDQITQVVIWGYGLPNLLEALQSVCRFWGSTTDALDVKSSDRHYLEFTFSQISGSGRGVAFLCYYDDIQEHGLAGSDFASLNRLDGITSLQFHGYVGPAVAQVAFALPNLKHLAILNQSPPFPDFYREMLPQLAGLQSFHLVARLPWSPLQAPVDSFAQWKSRETLEVIKLFNTGLSRSDLLPLRTFPRLKQVWVEDQGFIGESPCNILPELVDGSSCARRY